MILEFFTPGQDRIYHYEAVSIDKLAHDSIYIYLFHLHALSVNTLTHISYIHVWVHVYFRTTHSQFKKCITMHIKIMQQR